VVNGMKPKNERLPITKPIVVDLVAHCEESSYDGIAIKAAICVAFAGFLRIGEFTHNAWNSTSHESFISRGAVAFGEDSVTITLPKSKTDPFSKGVPITMSATGDSICPRDALKKLIARFKAPADPPLFSCNSQFSYRNGLYFTREWFMTNVRDLLTKGGRNPIGYSGHSFRKAAAHSAAAAGLSNEDIKTLGRWKSEAYRLYMGHDKARRLRLSTRLSHASHLRSAPRS